MKLHNKKSWYTRPRTGFIFGLSEWILHNPSAMSITAVMGHIVSIVLFTSLLGLALGYRWGIYSYIIFSLMLILTVRNFYKLLKISKQTGIEKIFNDLTIKEVIGGDKNEHNRKNI